MDSNPSCSMDEDGDIGGNGEDDEYDEEEAQDELSTSSSETA